MTTKASNKTYFSIRQLADILDTIDVKYSI